MTRSRCLLSVAIAASVASAACAGGAMQGSTAAANAAYGGVVITEWLRDGRTMKLLQDFVYVDGASKRWVAPKGSLVDGASIPRALWWSGGPYEGQYREASVVHDFYCAETPKTEKWRAVHRMFYDAMLTSGVTKARALIMYGAVYRHGPRWPDPVPPGVPAVPPPPRTAVPLDEDIKQIEGRVNSGEITSPEQIEALPLTIPPQ